MNKFDEESFSNSKQDPPEVQRLLNDDTALRFLIYWSWFESKCFDENMQINKFRPFVNEVVVNKNFDPDAFKKAGKYFHKRYQNSTRFRELFNNRPEIPGFPDIINKKFEDIDNYDLLFMLVVVVYRYRNNIFHGSKGVESWLYYKEQIQLCNDIMWKLISIY